jgi:hypothetical protein
MDGNGLLSNEAARVLATLVLAKTDLGNSGNPKIHPHGSSNPR